MSSTAQVPRHVHDGVGGTQPRRETVNLARLQRLLSETVGGEVRFDAASRVMYAGDASNFRQVPLGVVVPKSVQDVVATHRACAQVGAPIVNRGGSTSLSGETVNRAIVIDSSKYLHTIGDVDRERCAVRCSATPIASGAIVASVKVARR